MVKDAKKALGRSAFKPALKGVAQILDAWLSDMHTVASLEASLEQSIHKRLLYTLETSSFRMSPASMVLPRPTSSARMAPRGHSVSTLWATAT